MNKKMMFLAVAAVALMASCSGKKTAPNVSEADSANQADTTAAATVDLASVAGTYEGTLPAADCPGIKTVLTINADSTYELKQDYIDRPDSHDEASGVFQVLDGGVLMLVRPYKVKDAGSIVMTDSLGNEPEGEMAKLYVLKVKK